jgi:hypothetical protein
VIWNGLIWLRIGTNGELLCKRWWTIEFHEMLGYSCVAERPAASQEGLFSMDLVNCLSNCLPCDRIHATVLILHMLLPELTQDFLDVRVLPRWLWRVLMLWRLLLQNMLSDVSEECTTYIFRVGMSLRREADYTLKRFHLNTTWHTDEIRTRLELFRHELN